MRSFIKPMSYEKSKTRKWKNDIGRSENMKYLPRRGRLHLRERPQAEGRADVQASDEERLQEREDLLRLRGLRQLPDEGELHPR